MRLWIAWTGTLVAVLNAVSLTADVITITPDQDNTIFSNSDDRSNALGTLFTSTTNQANSRRALLRFDVSGYLPPGSQITAASLTLTVNGAANSMELDHGLHRLLQEWGEGTSSGTSGNGAPATPGDATWGFRLYPDTPWSTPGGDFIPAASASAPVGGEFGPVTWGSTPAMVADVQAWLDSPEANYGWIILGEEKMLGTARKFVNRESSNQDQRPALTIEFSPYENATFQVSKDFSDGRVDEVEVTLSCNTGLPLEQSATISGGGEGVIFVVTELEGEEASCQIAEVAGPAGYSPVFNDGNGCVWEGVSGGQYFCRITNLAEPARFMVTKEWVIADGEAETFLTQTIVSVFCNNEIDGGFFNGSQYQYDENLSGEIDFLEVSVDTLARSAECRATEDLVQGGVEVESDCDTRVIPAGGSSSCTITNTVLFHGIPTINGIGLGIFALLALGIGLLGIRRTV